MVLAQRARREARARARVYRDAVRDVFGGTKGIRVELLLYTFLTRIISFY
jgi:hypothetical protein